MNQNFWHGKRVFLTGHTGFKGSWLSLYLTMAGAHVTGYALPSEHPNGFYDCAGIGELMASTYADILDSDRLHQALKQSRAEMVIHMAAQSLVRESYRDPVRTYAVNVMGTAHLLEAVRKSPSVRGVLVVTTDKCYENQSKAAPNKTEGYRESDRLGGYDPYSNSKACAELVAASYRDAFLAPEGIAVATARAGNVIGGGDWAIDRLIPDLMRGIFNQKRVPIRYPNAIRPWQHVLEPLSGYLTLAQALCEKPEKAAGAWNFGPALADTQPVGYLVDSINRLWPGKLQWNLEEAVQPHESAVLTLDASKARLQLGWEPRLILDEALALTVEWYQGLYEADPLNQLSQAQIQRYQAAQSGETLMNCQEKVQLV